MEDDNRIKRRVRHKQTLAVLGGGKCARVTSATLPQAGLENTLGRKIGNRKCIYPIGVGQRHIKCPFVGAQQQSRWMRARRERVWRFLKFDPADNLATYQIQFGNAGGIPQAAPSAASITRGDAGVRE